MTKTRPQPRLISDLLDSVGACKKAVDWAGKRRVGAAAWRACPRADWMLWIAVRLGVDRRRVTLAACACARTVLRHVPSGEQRPRIAIETAERWARGEATIQEVRRASVAAGRGAGVVGVGAGGGAGGG